MKTTKLIQLLLSLLLAAVLLCTGVFLVSAAAGKPVPAVTAESQPQFQDVQESDYYYNAVLWAVDYGITQGTSETTFSPAQPCTSAQIVTFLWRAFREPEPETTQNRFMDVKAGKYYEKPVRWAAEQNITAGTTPTTFSPGRDCTRAQTLTFLWRACGSPAVSNAENPFQDVKAGSYYYRAVLWAIQTGITTGSSADMFYPNQTCTRAEAVTFLYRARDLLGLPETADVPEETDPNQGTWVPVP